MVEARRPGRSTRMAAMKSRPPWWGSQPHVIYTVVIFVVLASLDNAAMLLLPNMLLPVAEDLGVPESSLGVVTASVILITALTAVAWGYWGDRSSRKRLLLYGTVIWAVGTAASGTAGSLAGLWWWQSMTAVGLGSIASVGFSVISDFIRPGRRGLAMSFWGLSQGAGGLAGGLVASQLGAEQWRVPFLWLAGAGVLFAGLYLTTFDPERGRSESAISPTGAEFVIDRSQLPGLLKKKTNRWLILQGLTAQVAYGSLVWVPLLYQAKVAAEGYDVATATRVGGMFAAIFQLAAVSSIVAGHLGDRWQARNLRGRAYLSMIGILGAVPFFLVFFFVPLRGLEVTPLAEGGTTSSLVGEVLVSLVTNPWVALAFGMSIAALVLTSADSPNWFALIADVNLPEHRGTVFGAANLANGIGRGFGNLLTGVAAASLLGWFDEPLNYVVGLAAFQVFFLPTGYAYWRAARTAPEDIAAARAILAARSSPPVG